MAHDFLNLPWNFLTGDPSTAGKILVMLALVIVLARGRAIGLIGAVLANFLVVYAIGWMNGDLQTHAGQWYCLIWWCILNLFALAIWGVGQCILIAVKSINPAM